ncbi:hypothetical protein Zmor_016254 [Zophobas morio]|uniref:Uncharacterized protein n=1 Tax=Zophobas morio TaxID=2755281 RepID=A0AA38IIA2_9CUCU|nr:hypothetical protein Zmor_016254 [Zophobas morio]
MKRITMKHRIVVFVFGFCDFIPRNVDNVEKKYTVGRGGGKGASPWALGCTSALRGQRTLRFQTTILCFYGGCQRSLWGIVRRARGTGGVCGEVFSTDPP